LYNVKVMKNKKNKKERRHPAFMVSASDDDIVIVKALRDKYHINISAFFREKIFELYKKFENENS